MKKILCSTGAILGNESSSNHRLLDEYAEKLTCDGFELLIYRIWYENIDNIISDLTKMSLYIPVVHGDKRIGVKISRNEEGDLEDAIKLFDINCHLASEIGARKIVIHLWGGIESDRNINNNIEAFSIPNEIAIRYGVDLMVENVVCNRENPMKHILELSLKYPSISFTFDTKMAAFHEQVDLIYEDEWKWIWDKEHIKHMHINDYNGRYMDWGNLKALHIGDGSIDFDKFFEFLIHVGYSGDYTIEAPSLNQDGEVDFDKLNNSIGLLRSYIY